jgi:hypothetical protein
MKIYLAGPMSNVPQFNSPKFYSVSEKLRKLGYDVVSPAELDQNTDPEIAKEALASTDGKIVKDVAGHTWGDLLARDVKMLSDTGITGIVFLPGWQRSRGARCEASVGILNGFSFGAWDEASQDVKSLTTHDVATDLFLANLGRIVGSEP